MNIKLKISTIFKGLGASIIGTVLLFSPAFALSGSINGNLVCSYSTYNNITGVWVNALNGTDGWASWYATNSYGDAYWSYNLSQSTTSYTLAIGCGGTTQNWAQTFYATRSDSGLTITCAGSNDYNCINS